MKQSLLVNKIEMHIRDHGGADVNLEIGLS